MSESDSARKYRLLWKTLAKRLRYGMSYYLLNIEDFQKQEDELYSELKKLREKQDEKETHIFQLEDALRWEMKRSEMYRRRAFLLRSARLKLRKAQRKL